MLIVTMLMFFVAIFLLAAITAAISWMGFVKRSVEHSEAASEDLVPLDGDAGSDQQDSRILRDERFSSLSFWDSLLARFDFFDTLQTRLEQANLDWSVGRVSLAMLLSGTITLLIMSRFTALWCVPGALLAAYIPYAYVLGRRRRRFDKFRENFPDVLDSLARALRAGYALSAAMEMVGAETVPPVSDEMKRAAAEANLGMGWPRALENLGRRIPLLEVNLLISAVQLHSRTGGKLSEVMTGLAENMRESIALRGEVKALAAHGKLTGLVLTILPIGIALMMMVVSPTYMLVLVNHPLGPTLIGAAVGCLVLAHFVIRRLVDIKI